MNNSIPFLIFMKNFDIISYKLKENYMRFYSSQSDKESGISKVILEDNGKLYEGIAKCHEEDIWSNYFGEGIAEMRAIIKVFKNKLNKEKNEYKLLLNFVKTIESYKSYNKDSNEAKFIYRQLNIKKKKIEAIEKNIIAIKNKIENNISFRDKFLEKRNLKEK